MFNPVRRPAQTMALGAVAGAALFSSAAGAHHAITLNYDPSSSGVIEGVVEEVFWANPHVHYYLSVQAEDGSVELWDMEARNLNSMRARGVSRDTIQVGDRLVVTGMVGRSGAHAILADSVTQEDGTVLWGEFTPGADGALGPGEAVASSDDDY